MPHINRIRVNNVKYNFGTQFYDDFMMSFSSKNTIYDLANGGGKSVLMLLLLQNLIPNCTLDEKQPVEKLFRTNEGSTTIHSLVEWKLSDVHVKNGYKYMTTGFCARKAKDTSDDAIDENGENSRDGGRDGSSMEYFNYCIFYRDFNDNDIKNLPLSKGSGKEKERITYNGLKNYLRDIAKKDLSLEVHIFERKGQYQQFISKYGLYESEWEIIRGINKTEGHVRTYFESNYRTTRKVVEDLLIEEIIQKSFNNRIEATEEKDDMAKTLYDIKDKLMELAKKKEDINCYDMQNQALNTFVERVAAIGNLYDGQKELNEKVAIAYEYVTQVLLEYEKSLEGYDEEVESIYKDEKAARKVLETLKVMLKKESFNNLLPMLSTLQSEEEMANEIARVGNEELTLKEAINDYADYLYYKTERDKQRNYIDSVNVGDGAIIEELARFVGEKKERDDKRKDSLELKLKEEKTKEAEDIEIVDTLTKDIEESRNSVNISTYILERDNKSLELINEKISSDKINLDILMSTDIDKEASKNAERIEELKEQKEELEAKHKSAVRYVDKLSVSLAELDKQLKHNTEELVKVTELEEKNAFVNNKEHKIYSIYGTKEPLETIAAVGERIQTSLREKREIEDRVYKLLRYKENLENGCPAFDVERVDKVCDYLGKYHGNCYVKGSEYLKEVSQNEREEILERIPVLPYSIVITDRFSSILTDETLKQIETEDGFVPLIVEDAIKGGKDVIFGENMMIAARGNINPATVSKVVASISSENARIKVLDNAIEVYEEDLKWLRDFVRDGAYSAIDYRAQYEKLKEEKERINLDQSKYRENIAEGNATISELESNIYDLESKIRKCEKDEIIYARLKESIKEANEISVRIEENKEALLKARKTYESASSRIVAQKNILKARQEGIENIEKTLEELNAKWEKSYKKYYDVNKSMHSSYSDEEITAKIEGLIELLNNKRADLADKQKLIENYDRAMEKSLQAIDYKGIELSKIEKMYEDGTAHVSSREDLVTLKNKIKEEQAKSQLKAKEISKVQSQIDNMKGAIDAAIEEIIEKYGEYEDIAAGENYKLLMEAKEEYIKECNRRIELAKERYKELIASRQEKQMKHKELSKIVSVASIDTANYNRELADALDKEKLLVNIAEEYDAFASKVLRGREEFNRDRETLSDTLTRLGGIMLAEEIKRKATMPSNKEETQDLHNALKDIIECIELEKQRIGRSIEEMERIKDSFENQCIQSCINIKTELDRLPQLSKITMDEQVISIISLSIPYIKEEMYKEMMSKYIDNILTVADTLNSREDKIKYIKNQLAWKKMFSVIVKDMNAIKLTLYKRERIKEQSKYLPYEEAVGSTGQSQGIYIQFLIAIINYITNINSQAADNMGLKKVIFIDNPFGAAKDVYIWEPIFKLLKVNNVQLVVPARGVTPAITGRFDVNYVLGQKLINGRQQTVVVDFYSNVEGSKLEYETLSYEQVDMFAE